MLEQLRSFFRARRADVDEKFNRTLPFGDYIVDRWEKAKLLGFGEGVSIYDSALVIGDVTVGPRTWIGPSVVLDGSGRLEIGSNCSIGPCTQIFTHDSVQWAITGGEAPYEYAPTKIGKNCFIGPAVIILKGVTIGDGCIIGGGAVVTRDIPPGMMAVGSPARVIGSAVAKPIERPKAA